MLLIEFHGVGGGGGGTVVYLCNPESCPCDQDWQGQNSNQICKRNEKTVNT